MHKGRTPVLLAAVAMLGLAGCAHGRANKLAKADNAYQERPVELLYATGAERMDEHQWSAASSYFDEVERQHPYSEWARRAVLMEAFAHYEANQYDDAIAAADRFISLYPGSPNASYAYYLKAQCYFEQIVDVQRDQAYTQQAQTAFREVQKRYPTTQYAVDARLKQDMILDQLAGKEMSIGRWYLRQGLPLSSIDRFKVVVDKYQTTSHTPEALYRLVEANLTLGLRDEATKDGAVLGYNFPGDPWYSRAYSLLTSKGLRPSAPPKPKANGALSRIGRG
ncbi:outer membrane protein assembly factor BamD [Caulobacter sp. S45]|uniref:outer membrane protein assembly factor BamD n=1 Tax=Caulobacter sp. S45 TaxID=1641861 RepID=UPI0015761388|nr:outer membrane protein assembly factor BamD [Caulobacter sp. S45]